MVKTSKDLLNEKAGLIAECDTFEAESKTDTGLSEEKRGVFDSHLEKIRTLNTEIDSAERSERLATEKARMNEPSRPAVNVVEVTYKHDKQRTDFDGFNTWASVRAGVITKTTDTHYKARKAGFDLDDTKVSHEMDWSKLNWENRSKSRSALYTGGTGTGLEWLYTNYSSRLVDYMLLASPLMNYLSVENVDNFNDQVIFKRDDTALLADYNTASGGTELAPTVPDAVVASALATIKMFNLNSGYMKFTRQELHRSGVDIMDTIAKAGGLSLSRKIEKDVLTAAAAGTSAIGGIQAAGSQSGSDIPVASLAISDIEDLVYSIPQVYRDDAVLVTSESGEKKLHGIFKSTTGFSLFDRIASDPPNIKRVLGVPVVVSQWMPTYAAGNKPFLIFSKRFYRMTMWNQATLEILRDKFHPLISGYQECYAGGLWTGPNNAANWIKVVS